MNENCIVFRMYLATASLSSYLHFQHVVSGEKGSLIRKFYLISIVNVVSSGIQTSLQAWYSMVPLILQGVDLTFTFCFNCGLPSRYNVFTEKTESYSWICFGSSTFSIN